MATAATQVSHEMAIHPFRTFPFDKTAAYECLVEDKTSRVCRPYPLLSSDPLVVDVDGQIEFFFWDTMKKRFRRRVMSVCMGSSTATYVGEKTVKLRIKCPWCFNQKCLACEKTSKGCFTDCDCCAEHRDSLWAPGGMLAKQLARMY
jgi:hypothetical protein